MDHASEEAPLATETRTESQQVLVQPAGTTGSSNAHALKIAGITTLVVLLVSAQVFTAYMIFDQKQQIQGLQTNNQKLEKQMVARSRMPPAKMVMPIGSLPLLDFFDGEKNAQSPKPPKPEPPKNVAPPTVEEQLRELIKDQEIPEMNQSFLDNLQTLKQEFPEADWKSFESWLRYWLIFQMAQQNPTPSKEPVLVD